MADGSLWVTNANLTIWYALNSAHYSHNAAIKQSYLQRKSAGSLLLYASYMSSQVSIHDTLNIPNIGPLVPLLMSGMNGVQTRQVAIGLGYGINYTPNHGKVILHASAAALLVTYSYNQISYYIPDSVSQELPSDPMFQLKSSSPVHVTGNVRAAVSWEINKWAHLSAWATGENIRFRSAATTNNNSIFLSNWLWKVQLTLGVRFGAGKDRVQRALAAAENREPDPVLEMVVEPVLEPIGPLTIASADTTANVSADSTLYARIDSAAYTPVDSVHTEKATKKPKRRKREIPKWITGYFWSPK